MTNGSSGVARGDLRVVIADDEPLARLALRRALEAAGQVEVVAEAENGREAVELVRSERPDVVFLDIAMPELEGFEVVAELDPIHQPAIVFVTAHSEFALQAFDVRALDYLLKPFTDARLSDALERAREQRDERARRHVLHAVRDLMDTVEGEAAGGVVSDAAAADTGDTITRFAVPTEHGITFVAAASVQWFEASGNYVLLHVGRAVHRVRLTISALEERLDAARFVRVHRSAIVNLDQVQEVQRWFSGDYIALLKGGGQVRVSRSFRDALIRKTF